jgi:hypothetical protein
MSEFESHKPTEPDHMTIAKTIAFKRFVESTRSNRSGATGYPLPNGNLARVERKGDIVTYQEIDQRGRALVTEQAEKRVGQFLDTET